jgi:hypothetical protein
MGIIHIPGPDEIERIYDRQSADLNNALENPEALLKAVIEQFAEQGLTVTKDMLQPHLEGIQQGITSELERIDRSPDGETQIFRSTYPEFEFNPFTELAKSVFPEAIQNAQNQLIQSLSPELKIQYDHYINLRNEMQDTLDEKGGYTMAQFDESNAAWRYFETVLNPEQLKILEHIVDDIKGNEPYIDHLSMRDQFYQTAPHLTDPNDVVFDRPSIDTPTYYR